MRKAAAIALLVIGLCATAGPAAVLVWTYRQYAEGLLDELRPIMTVSTILGLACLAGGVRLLRGRRSA